MSGKFRWTKYLRNNRLLPDQGLEAVVLLEPSNAIYGLRDLELVRGYEDGSFNPNGEVTCEEAGIFFVNLYEYLQDNIS